MNTSTRTLIRIFDRNFSHERWASRCGVSKYIEWDREGPTGDFCVFTDGELPKVSEVDCCNKVAWILEPRSITPWPYSWLLANDNWKHFDKIVTHDLEFCTLVSNSIYAPFAGSWINEIDRSVFDKVGKKSVSIIASNKKDTIGHNLRHGVIKTLRGLVDTYGTGYAPIENKADALRDYRYSISIENSVIPGYFTEKLIDTCLCGCLPIYWGDIESAETIGLFVIPLSNFPNRDSFIEFLKIEDNFYQDHIKDVERNFQIALEYTSPDDLFFNAIKHML